MCFCRKPASAQKAYEQWFKEAPAKRGCRSDIVRPASARLWQGLAARCRRPFNTSVVEDINNTIKVIKRRAYGYRDEKHFFLKIRAAFPGNPRGTRNLPVSPCNSYTPISTGSLNVQHSALRKCAGRAEHVRRGLLAPASVSSLR
ncbi:transposase [Paraburkholderia youngii]|uniref:transposase n=1 Tax=Paraburkholderia youngii TaxID=2782701 RepID=UPI003D226384